ncbi:hypothetical protein BDZ45DRAFT_743429 [Acephala macrosclerotiorum]|nr:hypothetical protein BDZ45DRAFT_743429 [Acephala macrosclerotiorum]
MSPTEMVHTGTPLTQAHLSTLPNSPNASSERVVTLSSAQQFIEMAFNGMMCYVHLTTLVGYAHAACKAVPGPPGWPSIQEWVTFNRSLGGVLLKPPPPGSFHEGDPISIAFNNWNNDSCLPYPGIPCRGEGYPIYVVNATKPEHVWKGISFSRENIRLNVKCSGLGYLGRSVAPNSLSVWVRYTQGIQLHESFTPHGGEKDCDCIPEGLNASSPAIREVAEARMMNETGPVRLEPVQARLASSLYLLGLSRTDQAWYTFGTTSQMILALGLHRKKFSQSQVFWGAYTLDKYLSVILGRPRVFQDEDTDQPLPERTAEDTAVSGRAKSKPPESLCVSDGPTYHAKLVIIVAKSTSELYPVYRSEDIN